MYLLCTYPEADHCPCSGYPVRKGDEWLIWQEWDWLVRRGVKFITAIPCQAFDSSFLLEKIRKSVRCHLKVMRYLCMVAENYSQRLFRTNENSIWEILIGKNIYDIPCQAFLIVPFSWKLFRGMVMNKWKDRLVNIHRSKYLSNNISGSFFLEKTRKSVRCHLKVISYLCLAAENCFRELLWTIEKTV